MGSDHLPLASALFTGRQAELSRLEQSLKRVPVALIYGLAGMGKSALASALATRRTSRVVYHDAGAEPLGAFLASACLHLSGTASAMNSVEALALKAAECLDAHHCLWIIDGVHRIEAGEAAKLVRLSGQSLKTGRLIATSRERIQLGFGRSGSH